MIIWFTGKKYFLTNYAIGKKIRATELLPSIQAYRVVNDDAIRSKLVTCSRALEIVGHKLHVKAHAIKHKESDAAADSVEEIPTF